MILQAGQVLDQRYRVEKSVGSGGMAEVYQVWDAQRAAFLALKLLNADLAEDLVFLRRFKREAQALRNLTHPHIVRFYDLVEADQLTFFLMDFVEGMSLRSEIYQHKNPFTPERILEIFQPVCSALFYAHNQGVIHCDVKPANIMIETSGKVLLADFGISRLSETATTATSLGSAGTPAYMAPELVQGLRPRPATDVYSLGIVLFELLTGGERPFTGEAAQITGSTAEKVRWEQVHQSPPPVRAYNPQVSPEVEQVMLRCLEKDPGDRFATTQELIKSLEMAFEDRDRTSYEPADQATSAMPPGYQEAVPQPIFNPPAQASLSSQPLPSDAVRLPAQPVPKPAWPKPRTAAIFGSILIIGLIIGILLTNSGIPISATKTAALPTNDTASTKAAAGLISTSAPLETASSVSQTSAVTTAPTVITSTSIPSPSPDPNVVVSPKDGMAEIKIPAGNFFFGEFKTSGNLPDFWMDRTEVTNDMFSKFEEETHYTTNAEVDGWAYVYQRGFLTRFQEPPGANPEGPALPSPIKGIIRLSW